MIGLIQLTRSSISIVQSMLFSFLFNVTFLCLTNDLYRTATCWTLQWGKEHPWQSREPKRHRWARVDGVDGLVLVIKRLQMWNLSKLNFIKIKLQHYENWFAQLWTMHFYTFKWKELASKGVHTVNWIFFTWSAALYSNTLLIVSL